MCHHVARVLSTAGALVYRNRVIVALNCRSQAIEYANDASTILFVSDRVKRKLNEAAIALSRWVGSCWVSAWISTKSLWVPLRCPREIARFKHNR